MSLYEIKILNALATIALKIVDWVEKGEFMPAGEELLAKAVETFGNETNELKKRFGALDEKLEY